MLGNNSKDIFAIMKNECSILESSGKIESKEEKFFNKIVDMMSDFFENLKNEIMTSNVKHIVNVEYYKELINVENGKLKESKLLRNDPFYPLYKHLVNLLEILNKIKEPSASVENMTESEDFFIKSILSSQKGFLFNINMALCDELAIKLDGDLFWITLNKFTKNKFNIIMLQHIDSQQKYFNDCLNVNQKKLSEFISENATFEGVKGSYEMFCRVKNLEGTENNVENIKIIDSYKNVVQVIETNSAEAENNSQSNIDNHHAKKSISESFNEIKPEALTFEQEPNAGKSFYAAITDSRNHENVPAVSYLKSNDVSSFGNALYAPFLLIAFILFVLGVIKRRF
ncbi:hypothetical protein NBO_1328g0002 [Nosema bombycis CQ1]|uniref:Uncharacterized protein n=1 Tax=Nosema bombycis (strain CQ1 / CVCC 102059) TaxID=578461 RepID=R0LZQ6_NOSB1|nr:hypothetical protein NBO_1328g0002 [Nosema bombycis CQ1]|eukprot:EOB11269.1 hypothetical protein NBO_1328g0002 [Nosema bombycis CQ1]